MEVIDSLISHVKSEDVYSDLHTIMLLGAKRFRESEGFEKLLLIIYLILTPTTS